ncbi:MAG: hypothetical protein RMA76_10060 [Deltaproteobacteria bacterium]|jgi:hypothetical protein
MKSKLAFAWGVGGVCALLGFAVYRLVPVALEPLADDLMAMHYAAYAVSIVVMAYSEGYKAFQRGFAPRVVARALHASHAPTPLRVLLAPAFCMGLFDAERRRLIVSWCTTFGVIGLVLLVSGLDQPWRGAVDAGVVAGLSWGLAAIAWFTARGLIGHPPTVPSDVPGAAPAT